MNISGLAKAFYGHEKVSLLHLLKRLFTRAVVMLYIMLLANLFLLSQYLVVTVATANDVASFRCCHLKIRKQSHIMHYPMSGHITAPMFHLFPMLLSFKSCRAFLHRLRN